MGLARTKTVVSTLVLQSKHYNDLTGTERLKYLISHLQESLSCLAEVLLQNRRGLELIFLGRGGFCAALAEECCFYRDNSGEVKESVAGVREGVAKQKCR